MLLCYAGARTEPACEPGQGDSIVDVQNQILKFPLYDSEEGREN